MDFEISKLCIELFCTDEDTSLREVLTNLEIAILIRSLRRFNGNKRLTSEYLGLKPTTLCEKLKKHQIDPKKFILKTNEFRFEYPQKGGRIQGKRKK
ncbi:hypothetical protein KGY73_10915 [bacterium]|nr:hypothetical protein [bacterium]